MKIVFLILFSAIFFSLQGEAPKKMAFFACPVLGGLEWDPEDIKTGIPGSEEAIIYISEQFVKLGYEVTVFGAPPQESKHGHSKANPRFAQLTFSPEGAFDVAISCRMPRVAASLRRCAKKVYLWPHDICEQPVAEEEINGFDDVLWLSEWQRQQWISVSPGFAKFTKIFGNGINPEQFQCVQKRENPYACIYGSNYARGLEVLLNLWPMVKQQFPRATLDIYYGWKNWGRLSPEKEARMRSQIALFKELGVIDHGLVGHEELNRAYEKAAFWTYPCIEPEVFCITALRAQLAGAIPVVITGSALKETVLAGHQCVTRRQYFETLVNAMKHAEDVSIEERKKIGEFVLKQFTWENIAGQWDRLFKQ